MSELNYAADVEINPEALDVEWVRQASTYARYAQQAVKARDAYDRAKEALDVTRAELSLNVRSAPERYGVEKVTEGVVDAVVIKQAEYREANERLLNVRMEMEMIAVAVKALEQKKSALENLVRLHGQQYFAGPSVPRDLGAEWAREVQSKPARDGVREALNVGGGTRHKTKG